MMHPGLTTLVAAASRDDDGGGGEWMDGNRLDGKRG